MINNKLLRKWEMISKCISWDMVTYLWGQKQHKRTSDAEMGASLSQEIREGSLEEVAFHREGGSQAGVGKGHSWQREQQQLTYTAYSDPFQVFPFFICLFFPTWLPN